MKARVSIVEFPRENVLLSNNVLVFFSARIDTLPEVFFASMWAAFFQVIPSDTQV